VKVTSSSKFFGAVEKATLLALDSDAAEYEELEDDFLMIANEG